MKKVVSISLTLLMLIALLHLSIATHYCGGLEESSKLSFSGKLASCGMEDENSNIPLTGVNISRHCCENTLVFFGVNGNYFPYQYSTPESFQDNFQVLALADELELHSLISVKTLLSNTSPPGEYFSNKVSLTEICTFRI